MKDLSFKKKMFIRTIITKNKLLEIIRFDSKVCSFFLFVIYLFEYYQKKLMYGDLTSLYTVGKIFRHVQIDKFRKFAEKKLKLCLKKHGRKNVGNFFMNNMKVDEENIARLKKTLFEIKPFDRRLIILSVPKQNKKGVLLLKFTDYFSYFMKIFDLEKVSQKYIIIVEPSFIGYFNPAILCLLSFPDTVIIEAPEIIDFEFIKKLDSNLMPIYLGANEWVDSRIFYNIKLNEKKYDIIMVAIWADFKRHYHLFEAMSKSKNRNKIKIALVGAPWPKTLNSIREMAIYYGVNEYIEFFENIDQKELNVLFNLSKICILLSKKEGFNKSIIEAMYADIPVFILEGFNYGQKYQYINPKTGGYIKPKSLINFIDNIDKIIYINEFSPRKWIEKNINILNTSNKIKNTLSTIENDYNIQINKDIAEKINNPDCDYKNQKLWKLYNPYYKELIQLTKY